MHKMLTWLKHYWNRKKYMFSEDEVSSQVFSLFSNIIGGIKLLVPTEEAERAFHILKEGGYIKD